MITPSDITNKGIEMLLAEAAEGFKKAILTSENIAAYLAGTLDPNTRANMDAIFQKEHRVVRPALEKLTNNRYECLAHAAASAHQPADRLLWHETEDSSGGRASFEVFIRRHETGKGQRVARLISANEKMTGIRVDLRLNDQPLGDKQMQQFADWWQVEWELPEQSGSLTINILPQTEAESKSPDTNVIPSPATQ